MNDKEKPKHQLLIEIATLQKRVAELEDMCERLKDLEKKLQESESRYRELVEKANIAILIDDPEGKFKYFNEKFAKLFGYPEEEMEKQTIRTLVHPDDLEKVLRFHNDRIQGKDVPPRYEFRGIKKDGSTIFLEVTAIELKEGEKIVGTRSYIWDVGARKEMEQELRKSREELEKRIEERTAELKKSNELLKQKITEGERVEQALRDSEARYLALFDRSLLCIFIHDFEGKFLDANDAALKLLGYTRDEIPNINFATLLSEDQLPTAFEKLEEIKQTGYQKNLAEYRLKKKDGQYVWIETEAALMYHDGKPFAILGVARDISERKHAEGLLKTAEEEKAMVLDSILEIVVYHDKDLKILWANNAAAKSVSMMPSQLVGRYCYEIWHNRDSPCLGCPVEDAIKRGQPHLGEITIPDGRIWMVRGYPVRDENNEIIGAVEVVLDITIIKQAEEALQKSEAKYKTLTDNINVGIYRNTVGPKGKFIEANPAIVKMFGYGSKDDFLAINVADLYQKPEDRKRFNEKMLTYGFVRNEELMLKKKDGIPLAGSVSAVAVKDDTGNIKYYDGIIEDITERKRAEQELKESYHTLKKILDGTVNALASTTEKRDPYTAGHQHRVTQLACAIAEEMGLPAEQIEAIRVAGIVHDLGKIYVAAEILSKPIRLKDIEMALVKAHCKAGYDILKTIEFPWPIADIVYQHHERLDGSGYPQGLRGDYILLEAKILAVADVVEAMSSHRPYRSALSLEEALDEIKKNRAILYEPEVVDTCLRVFEKGFEFK
jgi:PAS domain S-box-containing protein/putative nucleotidyltransferase with HDIG domain